MLRKKTSNSIMKAIAVLFAIYVASVTALEKGISDERFPITSEIIQAKLNNSDIVTIRYTLSEDKKVIDYNVVASKDTCGPFKVEIEKDSLYNDYFHLLPLNPENVLLIPMARDSKFNEYPALIEIINLENCKRNPVALPDQQKPIEFKITRYDDSFDIYYKDSAKCAKNYCRAAYDFQGKAISPAFKTFNSNKGVPLVKPLDSGKRTNKYIAIESTEEKITVNLVDSEKVNVLAEITETNLNPEVSSTKNLISVVFRSGFEVGADTELITHLKVIQFDSNGKLKFETTLKYNASIRTTRILNAPNGGVYLVASACDRDHCTDEQNIYFVKRLDGNGKEVGSGFPLRLLSPGIIEDLALYESDNEYCLTRLQLSLGVSGQWQFKKLDALYNCFTDKDFE